MSDPDILRSIANKISGVGLGKCYQEHLRAIANRIDKDQVKK